MDPLLALVGLVLIVKVYNASDPIEGLTDTVRFVVAFAAGVGLLFGAMGHWGMFGTVTGLVVAFYGLKWLYDVVQHQAATHVTPAPAPPPPARSEWNYSDD